jgi:hypothetical protein
VNPVIRFKQISHLGERTSVGVSPGSQYRRSPSLAGGVAGAIHGARGSQPAPA